VIDLKSIKAGLENGEFALEYLPIVSLDSERCIGVEALVRWQHPAGVIFPDDFVPLIENTPLSGLVTYWVIDQVALELGDWLRKQDNVELHINVPPELLGRGGLEYAAQKSGLSDVRHKVVLEITERGLPDQLGLQALELATNQGVRIALDDVTIDPANVLVLSRTHAKIIKIDKSVLLDDHPGTGTPHWAEALAVLLRTTDLEVIVEGVETAEQIGLLRAAGVKQAQGYYFSPPLPAQEFLHYFARHA
jgi:EAL domain-containing protein (putative c-di-GMP-specific phosphodiesterase class I)